MGADKPSKPERSALQALEQTGLAALVARAGELASLDRLLRRNLPEALAKQCRLGAWREGRLVFQVSNPVWKNKLRLHSREILDQANALGLPAREIRITIDLAFQPGDDR